MSQDTRIPSAQPAPTEEQVNAALDIWFCTESTFEDRMRDALLAAAPAATQPGSSQAEHINIQEAWEAAGGNPGIKATKAELLDALRLLNEVCDDAATQPEGQDAMFRNITWPKARDVGRIGDMSPSASMRVGFDSDNDVFVSVWGEDGGASVEFCTPGPGGGASSRTREALIALMVAIEADNAERPDRDWWARRNKPAAQAAAGNRPLGGA